jgi:hypothetical protein
MGPGVTLARGWFCPHSLLAQPKPPPAFTGRESAAFRVSFPKCPGARGWHRSPGCGILGRWHPGTRTAPWLGPPPWIVAIGRRTVFVAPPMIFLVRVAHSYSRGIYEHKESLTRWRALNSVALFALEQSHPQATPRRRQKAEWRMQKAAQSQPKAVSRPPSSQVQAKSMGGTLLCSSCVPLVFLLCSSCSARLIRTGSREHPGGSTEPRCAFDRTGAAGNQSF